MQEELKIPKPADYNSSQPDYVERLEQGFVEVVREATIQENSLSELKQRLVKQFIDELKGLEGVVLKEFPDIEAIIVGRKTSKRLSLGGMFVQTSGVEVNRKIEDIMKESQRKYEDQSRPIQDNLKKTERASEDFTVAITDMTKVMPLNEISSQYNFLHFYMPRQEEVYESHIDITMETRGEPMINSNLNPDQFNNQEFLKNFRKQSKGKGANAYLITNPSRIIPVYVLVEQGIRRFEEISGRKVKKQEEKSTPFPSNIFNQVGEA